MIMAIVALVSPGPIDAATAIASSTAGSESVISTARMIMASTMPPRKPAIAPSALPTPAPASTTTTEIGSDCCAPNSVRVNTSRPRASVPSQCSALGGRSRRATICNGSYGAHPLHGQRHDDPEQHDQQPDQCRQRHPAVPPPTLVEVGPAGLAQVRGRCGVGGGLCDCKHHEC